MATRKQATVQEQATYLLQARKVSRGRPKKWENFTAQEKRVAIAYDVIQAVLASVYEPIAQNGYIKRGVLEEAAEAVLTNSVQALLKEPGLVQNCEVCALGACFLSLTRFENHISVTELDEVSFGYRSSGGRQRLAENFTPLQLDLIESAFERSFADSFDDGDFSDNYTGKENALMKKAKSFGFDHEDDTDRLLAIFINVVKNKGTFKP